jgi:hypothetical protein
MFKFDFELDDADAQEEVEEETPASAATAPFAEITLHQLVCTRLFFVIGD